MGIFDFLKGKSNEAKIINKAEDCTSNGFEAKKTCASKNQQEGLTLMQSGNLNDAKQLFNKAIDLSNSLLMTNENDADLYLTKALSLTFLNNIEIQETGNLDKKNVRDSMEAFKKMIEVAPPNYDSRKIEQAKEMLEKWEQMPF